VRLLTEQYWLLLTELMSGAILIEIYRRIMVTQEELMRMESGDSTSAQSVSAGIRRLTKAISLLAVVVGPLLFLLADRTDTLFAWTIAPPLTAAFLGGAYTTALVIELLAARERSWTRARVVYPAMLLFTTLTLIATLLHLDKFHLSSSGIALTTAWMWLIIYLVASPVMLVLLVLQLRSPGIELPRRNPLPLWFRIVLIVQAAVMMGLGAALFLAPTTANSIWPWALTALTAQAVAAWMLGLGLAVAQSAWENDWGRIYIGLVGDVVLGMLQLVAVARYADTINWSAPNGWVYVLFLGAIVAVGLYGLYARRLARVQLPMPEQERTPAVPSA
jgi:hypothetical protein